MILVAQVQANPAYSPFGKLSKAFREIRMRTTLNLGERLIMEAMKIKGNMSYPMRSIGLF